MPCSWLKTVIKYDAAMTFRHSWTVHKQTAKKRQAPSDIARLELIRNRLILIILSHDEKQRNDNNGSATRLETCLHASLNDKRKKEMEGDQPNTRKKCV